MRANHAEKSARVKPDPCSLRRKEADGVVAFAIHLLRAAAASKSCFPMPNWLKIEACKSLVVVVPVISLLVCQQTLLEKQSL